jgi:hypothetical protein
MSNSTLRLARAIAATNSALLDIAKTLRATAGDLTPAQQDEVATQLNRMLDVVVENDNALRLAYPALADLT